MMNIDVPASVAITVHEEARPGQEPPAQEEFAAGWEEVLDLCAGEFTSDGLGGDGEAEQSLQEYSPYGMWGFRTSTNFDPGVDYGLRGQTITGHLVHYYTGDISIRALGLNMEEEDFEEILEAQLSKLKEAS